MEDSVYYHEPHRITFFLQSLSSKFHSFWNYGKKDSSKRFINIGNKDLTLARLSLIYSVKIVLNNGGTIDKYMGGYDIYESLISDHMPVYLSFPY